MAELEGTWSAYLPVSPMAACEAVLDVAGYPKWWSRTVATAGSRGVNGKAMVGSRIEVRMEKVSYEYEVRKIETGRRIDLDCVGGAYRGKAWWTFAAEGTGTRATYAIAHDPAGLLSRLTGNAADARAAYGKAVASSLERLAANLAG